MRPEPQPLPDLTQRGKVVILGAARSGLAAAQYLQSKGFEVALSDSQKLRDEARQQLEAASIPYEEEGHSESFLQQADFLIASPGIPLTAPPYLIADRHQIPICSEIEMACQHRQIKTVAVTGSNGKSTTVSLIHALCSAAGLRSAAGGNIGSPMSGLLEQDLDLLILEISSYQLENTWSLKPEIAVFLNLYENHLERHGTMEHYAATKARLFAKQSPSDHAILNGSNEWTQALGDQLKAQVHWFGEHPDPQTMSVRVQGPELYYRNQALMPLTDIVLPGSHNLENICAALCVAELLEIPPETIKEVLKHFTGMPHRLENVAQWQGRRFINDSKSTNYLAAQRALESLDAPIVLLLGGQDKGGDMSALLQRIHERTKQVVLFGACAEDFQHRLVQSGYNQIIQRQSLAEALDAAFTHSESGDIILLSPATASFDAYRDFEHRGDDFKHHVAALISKTPGNH